ncbi:MAG: DUF2785 domain-containing protein [Archangium sp.]|nr:DUF2785 domain-containing protein [Archangium sp.]MDP3155951.1 DUF2785 domain-containing protein [Archangium sp.]MDP3576153.1 DUF2785 domain-containing protein [Archangium sp.]
MVRGLLAVMVVLTGCAHGSRVTEPPRGRAFWLSLRDAKFALPAGESQEAVLRDAETLVDSEDPVLRDEVGYGLVVAWVYQQKSVPAPALLELTSRLQERLKNLASPVLGRSFSALSLSIIAAAELKQPVLSQSQFDALVEAATDELVLEPDLRGHDAKLGWIHATAHTADLLKFLARDDRLTGGQQDRIINAIVHRLSHGTSFVWGEEERLAAVLRSLIMRKDARVPVMTAWLGTLGPAWKRLWSTPVLNRDEYAHLSNVKLTLRSLYVSLSASEQTPMVDATRADVLEALSALQ